ncbi:hypothetical protein BX600DRAFT_444524 [Xylariales sp. PMI_506]|nr:hypothetical protein BX600DRAFT_444524 [Xylariales sp. PMI_506]
MQPGSKQSFRTIASRVDLPGRQDKDANIFQLVHDWLDNTRRKWLLVLDNVDDATFLFERDEKQLGQMIGGIGRNEQEPLVSYLPRCSNGSILITTRSTDAAQKLVEEDDIIVVKTMTQNEAVTLIENKLGTQDNRGEVCELVTALECMPLAIVQAAAYISKRAPRCSIRQYLDQFNKNDRKKESLLEVEGGQLRRDREAKNSIIITWQISFEHIQMINPSAADLLSLMSFFDRQGIPESLVQIRDVDEVNDNTEDDDNSEEGASDSDTDDMFEDSVATLRDYSFISVNHDGATF